MPAIVMSSRLRKRELSVFGATEAVQDCPDVFNHFCLWTKVCVTRYHEFTLVLLAVNS